MMHGQKIIKLMTAVLFKLLTLLPYKCSN